jgi:anti-sigma-K factor RskA
MTNDNGSVDELTQLRSWRIDATQWEAPPDDVWMRIASEAGVGALALDQPDEHNLSASNVSAFRPRSRTMSAVVGIAAAAVLVGVVTAVVRRDSSEVVAAVDLDLLRGAGSGRAELVKVDSGLQLRLDTSNLDAADGYLEVWMINPTVTDMVSLGPLQDDGTYDLPQGFDANEFPIVDISAELFDNNPAHSGDSLLRGSLPGS